MADTFFPELDKPAATTSAAKADTFFPELDQSKAPQGSPLEPLKAAAAQIVPSALSTMEQGANLLQGGRRELGKYLPTGVIDYLGVPDPQQGIDLANQMAGAGQQPYMDVTGPVRQNKWFMGQSPAELAKAHPWASMAGEIAGQAPYMLMGGAAADLKALPLMGRLAARFGIGATEGAAYMAGSNAADQLKANDAIDPAALGQAAKIGGIFGGSLGLGMAGLGEGWAALKGAGEARQAAQQEADRVAQQEAELYGKQRPLTDEEHEAMTAGGSDPRQAEQMAGPPVSLDHSPVPAPWERPPEPATPPPPEKIVGPYDIKPGAQHRGGIRGGAQPPLEGHIEETVTADPKQMQEDIRKVLEDKAEHVNFDDDSWRTFRERDARPATPSEHRLLHGLARLSVVRDRAKAKFAGAMRQLEEEWGLTDPGRKHITPKFDALRHFYAKEFGTPSTTKRQAVETTLAPGHQHPQEYTFKGQGKLDQAEELQKLAEAYKIADKNYQDWKAKFAGRLQLIEENQPIRVEVDDEKGKIFHVNVQRTVRPEKYTFPTAQLEADYAALVAKLQALSGPYHDRLPVDFQRIVNASLQGNRLLNKLRQEGAFEWFTRQSPSTRAKLILTGSLAAAAVLGQEQEAHAAEPEIVAKTIANAAKEGFRPWMGGRVFSKVSMNEVRTDIIARGYDTASKSFAAVRNQYNADLRIANAFSRHLTPEEETAIKDLTPTQIAITSKLSGWTAREKQKLSEQEQLHKRYQKALQGEIERVVKDPRKMPDKARYARMLDHDLADMGGVMSSPSKLDKAGELYNKLFGGIVKSVAWGNYRMASLHLAEMVTAYGSKHPLAFGAAVKGLATDPVYREFALANSPHGMFQQILEGQEGFIWQKRIDKEVNGRIDKAIESLPGGKQINEALSAQLPERAKLGLGATVTAQHWGQTYPGGPRQYMADWVAYAKHGTPVPASRQAAFARIAINSFIEDNKAVMFLPEGRLKEATIFQRHQLLKPLYGWMRAKVQQGRLMTGLWDDLGDALGKGDVYEIAHAIKSLLLAHTIVATVAGSAAVPYYMWAALEGIDRTTSGGTHNVDALKDLLDKTPDGHYRYEMRDFGTNYFAFSKDPSLTLASPVDSISRAIMPKTQKDVVGGGITLAAMTIINRIGPEGSLNLNYLAERLLNGHGQRFTRRADSFPISTTMNKLMGRPMAPVTGSHANPMDPGEAAMHWLLKVETPKEVGWSRAAANKERRMNEHDVREFRRRWHQVMR